jgi:hypothetical protein
MLRVLGSIQNSEYASTLKTEQNNLASWVKEIHAGIYPFLVRHYPYTTLEYIHTTAYLSGLEHEPLPQLRLTARHIIRQLPRRVLHRAPCQHGIPSLPSLGRAFAPPSC